jgi:hypothetical protein
MILIKGGMGCITGILAYISDFMLKLLFGGLSHFSETALVFLFGMNSHTFFNISKLIKLLDMNVFKISYLNSNQILATL